MDEKHHLTPRFLLSRFSNGRQIVMSDRALRRHIPTSVERAGKIGSYYSLEDVQGVEVRLPADRIRELASDPGLSESILKINSDRVQLRPDSIERFLAYVEKKVAPILDRIAFAGPPTEENGRGEERFWVSFFIALQSVRGESFRDVLDDGMRLFIREQIRVDPDPWVARWRTTFPERAREKGDRDVIAAILKSLNGIRLEKSARLGEMLPLAFNELGPRLMGGKWRVLEYDAPDIVTSDEAVGLWARPDRDLNRHPLAMGTADAIYFPIDAHHTLQLVHGDSPVTERLCPGSRTKLCHSNDSVASAAVRWIYSHPDSNALEGLDISARQTLRRQVTARRESDHEGREIIRLFRSNTPAAL